MVRHLAAVFHEVVAKIFEYVSEALRPFLFALFALVAAHLKRSLKLFDVFSGVDFNFGGGDQVVLGLARGFGTGQFGPAVIANQVLLLSARLEGVVP